MHFFTFFVEPLMPDILFYYYARDVDVLQFIVDIFLYQLKCQVLCNAFI